MRTRLFVGYETIRSHTQATEGRWHVAHVGAFTIGQARTPLGFVHALNQEGSPPSHTVTGGTNTERTSPQRHGR